MPQVTNPDGTRIGDSLNPLTVGGTDSNTISAVIVATDTNVTLDFATGGAGSAAVVCNGFTL